MELLSLQNFKHSQLGGDLLKCAMGRMALRIQETWNWDPSGEYGGWACYKSNVECKAAILLPPEMLQAIRWSSSDSNHCAECQHCTGCIVSDIGMVSTYFVNQNASDDLFYDGIAQTRAVMKRCVAMGVAKIVLGCHLNFQLGARISETTGDCVYKDVDGWSSERAGTFLALCVEFDLVVSNTFGPCRTKIVDACDVGNR